MHAQVSFLERPRGLPLHFRAAKLRITPPRLKAMSRTSTPAATQEVSAGAAARLRDAAIGSIFALVLLLPKLLNLRRDRRTWVAFRILLAFAGASLVILPLSLWNSWTAGIAGLAMFLAAIDRKSTRLTPVTR